MQSVTTFRVILWTLLIAFFTSCSKDTGLGSGSGGNSGGSGNSSGSGSGGNPTAPPLFVEIQPRSIETALPAGAFELEARPFYTTTPVPPVLNLVEWKAIAGPAGSLIQPAAGLIPSISQLGYGVYVFQCKVRDQAGKSDSATAVISVHDPARPEQTVTITNQSWADGGLGRHFRINLYQHIPPGTALKQVFLKTDCSSSFIRIFNFYDFWFNAYTYWLEYSNNTIWLHVGNYNTGADLCNLPQDTPDIKLVY